jgi:hypothetical protein
MAAETFNRYEKKYRIGEAALARLQSGIADYMRPDGHCQGQGHGHGQGLGQGLGQWQGHGAYTVANIYFDTGDSALIRASLAKPAYKEKLRLRAYGTPGPDAMVYAEIKRKVGGMVNKRRSALRLPEAYAFLERGEFPEARPYMNLQVLSEIARLLERCALRPALYLAYERVAYVEGGQSVQAAQSGQGGRDWQGVHAAHDWNDGQGGHDGQVAHDGQDGLRVSFDTKIRARRTDLRLESGVYGEPLLGEGEWLMEIKTARSMPLWLCRLLSENGAYPCGFSKYGFEYLRTLGRRAVGPKYAPREAGRGTGQPAQPFAAGAAATSAATAAATTAAATATAATAAIAAAAAAANINMTIGGTDV